MTKMKHDALFKQIMSNEVAARDFLEHYLPADFKQQLDLSKIKLEKESYVEDDLRHRLNDIVYSIATKDNAKAFCYVLIEQQSTCDHWMALRLMKYILLLCERHKKSRSKLPLVCPLVFYNGKEPYVAPRNFWQLFVDANQAQKLIGADYQLIDLQSMSDDEIKRKEYLGIMEYCMKHIHQRDMLQLWDKLLQAFNHYIILDKEKGYIYIIPLLWYTSTKVPAEQQGELNKIIQNYLSTTGEDNIMRSIAQKYLDEGKAEGIQIGEAKGIAKGKAEGIAKGKAEGIAKGKAEGIAEGKAEGMFTAKVEIAKNLLKSGINIELVAKSTGLTIKEIELIKGS